MNKTIARLGEFIFLGVFVSTTFFSPFVASAQTVDELQSQVNQLLQQINDLTAQLSSLQQIAGTTPTTPTTPTPPPTFGSLVFTFKLYFGVSDKTTGGQVTLLQKFLAKDKLIYPEGIISGYYGLLTQKAVQAWQKKQGLVSSGTPDTTGYGAVGPKTRALLNQVYGGGTLTQGTSPTPQITATSTPTSTTAGAAFTITGKGFATSTTNNVYFGPTLYSNLSSKDGKTLIIVIPTSTPSGTYNLSIFNQGGFSNVVNIRVGPPPFIITATGTISIAQPLSTGSNATSTTINVQSMSTTSYLVSFSAKGLPTGASIATMASCVPTCSSVVTITIHNTTLPGTYPITIQGVALNTATATAAVTINLVVTPAQAFVFNLGTTTDRTIPKPIVKSVTSSIAFLVTAQSGVPQSVAFTQSGFPSGVTGSITLCKIFPCNATGTLTIGTAVATGTYPILVTASGGGYVATTTYNLVIAEPLSFSFHVTDSNDVMIIKPVTGSMAASNTVTVSLDNGYTQSITLTQSGFPTGTSATSLGTCSPQCTKTNTVTVRSNATPGTYIIAVRGTGGGVTSETSYMLTILAPDMTFDLSNTGDIAIDAPQTGSASGVNTLIADLVDGTPQPVIFRQTGLPFGASATTLTSCTPTCQAENTITVSSYTPSGTYPITVTASSTAFSATTQYNLIIQ